MGVSQTAGKIWDWLLLIQLSDKLLWNVRVAQQTMPSLPVASQSWRAAGQRCQKCQL
jgi:hypothetical protein